MSTKIKTREEWLIKATALLKPTFKKLNAPIPAKLMLGCGWPRGGKAEVIGQCFGKTWTGDETTHIFISPTQANDIEVLAILAHELVHAAVGCEEGHKGRFKKVARELGLEGKLTATTVSEKSPLYPLLQEISKKLGKYPHSKMSNKGKGSKGGSGYKWPRLVSPTIPEYTFQMSPKLIAKHGFPLDPVGDRMIVKE
jgi:hypothetical protein